MGDFTIPFEFKLPDHIPASIMYKNENTKEKPKSVVQYSIRSKIINHDGTYLKYKQMLVVHEPPVPFEAEAWKQHSVNLMSYCCCDKGFATMQSRFNKNVFYSNEIAMADIALDNSKAQVNATEMEFQVVQKLRISGGSGWLDGGRELSKSYDLLENQDHNVVPAGNADLVIKNFSLNLADIKYAINPHRSKKNKPRSPEEMFMMSQLPPATHSRHITNEYFLNANIKHDGCTYCGPQPSISTPLTIIPMTHMESYGFLEPAGYNPT